MEKMHTISIIFVNPGKELRYLPALPHDTIPKHTQEAVTDNGLSGFLIVVHSPGQNTVYLKRKLLKLYSSLRTQVAFTSPDSGIVDISVFLLELLREFTIKIAVPKTGKKLSWESVFGVLQAPFLNTIPFPDLFGVIREITIKRLLLHKMQSNLYNPCKLLADRKKAVSDSTKRAEYLVPLASVAMKDETTTEDFNLDCSLFVDRVMKSLEKRGFQRALPGIRLTRLRGFS